MSALTVAKTLGGAAVSDTLDGGGTGVDIGPCLEGQYAPIVLKSANTGWQSLYLTHDGASAITGVKTFLAQYSQAYGGGATAAADYAAMKLKGFNSGNSANNADGLSSGLRIEHDADLLGTLGLSAFDGTRAQVKIYGKANLGIDLDTAYDLHVDALLWDNAGTPVDATTPVTGQIGASGDQVLGDTALVKLRVYLEDNPPAAGVHQFDWVTSFAFTA